MYNHHHLLKRSIAALLVLIVMVGGLVSVPQARADTAACGQHYVVQPGDHLYRIALAAGTSWPALAQLNNLDDGNQIFVGQVLCLGTGTIVPSASPTPATITVAQINVIDACKTKVLLTVVVPSTIYYLPSRSANSTTRLNRGARYFVCTNHTNPDWQVFFLGKLPPLFVPSGVFG